MNHGLQWLLKSALKAIWRRLALCLKQLVHGRVRCRGWVDSQHTIAKGAVFKNDPVNYLVTPNTRIFNLVHPITGISESIIPITISPTNQPSD